MHQHKLNSLRGGEFQIASEGQHFGGTCKGQGEYEGDAEETCRYIDYL